MAQNEYNKSTIAAGDVEAAGRRIMKQQYQGNRQTMIKKAKKITRSQYGSPRRSKAR